MHLTDAYSPYQGRTSPQHADLKRTLIYKELTQFNKRISTVQRNCLKFWTLGLGPFASVASQNKPLHGCYHRKYRMQLRGMHWPGSDSQQGPMETQDTACNRCSCGQQVCSGTWDNQSCWSPSSARERKQTLKSPNSSHEKHASKAASELCGSFVHQDKNYK